MQPIRSHRPPGRRGRPTREDARREDGEEDPPPRGGPPRAFLRVPVERETPFPVPFFHVTKFLLLLLLHLHLPLPLLLHLLLLFPVVQPPSPSSRLRRPKQLRDAYLPP